MNELTFPNGTANSCYLKKSLYKNKKKGLVLVYSFFVCASRQKKYRLSVKKSRYKKETFDIWKSSSKNGSMFHLQKQQLWKGQKRETSGKIYLFSI